jgi:hypothetical protein
MLHLVHLHLVRLQLDLVLQLPLYNYYNYCTQVIGTHLTRRLRPGKEHVVERAPPDILRTRRARDLDTRPRVSEIIRARWLIDLRERRGPAACRGRLKRDEKQEKKGTTSGIFSLASSSPRPPLLLGLLFSSPSSSPLPPLLLGLLFSSPSSSPLPPLLLFLLFSPLLSSSLLLLSYFLLPLSSPLTSSSLTPPALLL